MLDDLKTDLGIFDDSKNTMLQRLLTKATRDVMNITHQNERYVKANLYEQIIDIAIIRYNKRGAEGLTSQSNSGSSENYCSDIPDNVLRVLYCHRRPKQ